MKLAINGGKKVRTKPFPGQYSEGLHVKDPKLNFLNDFGMYEIISKKIKHNILSYYRGNATENFWGGPCVQEFEKEFAKKFNFKYALAVNSCTSGLQLACGALGVSPGDKVIVTPWSMSCSATAPVIWGGIPVFADIEKDYFCLDPDSVEQVIQENDNVVGMIAVDLFGQPFNPKLREIADKYGIWIIEDAAQAPGSYLEVQASNGLLKHYAGSFGDVSCFSFTQGKHMTTGEGGMICTANDELYEKLALLRNHSEAVINDKHRSDVHHANHLPGFNMRMTEIQAIIGLEQLKKLDGYIQNRRNNVFRINEGIKGIPFITPAKTRKDTFHSYYVQPWLFDENLGKGRIFKRNYFIDAVRSELSEEEGRLDRGIPIGCGYIKPLYRMPFFNKELYLPNVEKLWESELFLSLYHGLPLSNEDVQDVVDAFMKVYENLEELLW